MKITIRTATPEDLASVYVVESICFPAAEAASEKAFKDRIQTFAEGFLVAELNQKIIGFINGAATNNSKIEDDMFKTMAHHIPTGENLAIFGLDVLPEYQRQGYAAQLMEAFIAMAKTSCKKRVLLTCKEHLVHYYEKFGFISEGISESAHGGAVWYDMYKQL